MFWMLLGGISKKETAGQWARVVTIDESDSPESNVSRADGCRAGR